MKTRFVFLRSALAINSLLLLAVQTHAQETLRVDDTPALAATLLPTVNVTPDAANPETAAHFSVAPTAPLHVTLLPTVHVNLRVHGLIGAVPASVSGARTNVAAL